MHCRCARALHATLVELDELLCRRHFDEALDLATRGLARRLPEADFNTRLRIGRSHALWMGGRVAPARSEANRAFRESTDPLTRARAADALALFAWKEAQFADAQAFAAAARSVYEARAVRSGVARSLQAEAGILADRGQLAPALEVQTRRIEALSRSTPERLGEARADRSTLLCLLGRWDEAARDLSAAADLFRRQRTPGALALKQAAFELARGRASNSRQFLEQARESERLRPSSPRVLADACIVGSDVALAAGLAAEAEREAAEGIRWFALLGDRGGECRSRVRRAQSLLALGRFAEAVLEAERALRGAAAAGEGIEALAELVVGQALLRTRRNAAEEVFVRAERAARQRPDLTHAARLGQALARRDPPRSIEAELAGLERWGDLRLLEFARVEVESLCGGRSESLRPRAVRPTTSGHSHRERALVDAALALQAEGDWPLRWARAMKALKPAVPFERVALFTRDGVGLELRDEGERPEVLAPDDIAHDVARRTRGAAGFELRGRGLESGATSSRLSLVTPVKGATFLYAERRRAAGEGDLDLVTLAARLLVPHLPEADAPSAEREPPAIPGFVGRSEPMRALFADIVRTAASEATVHIFGETGTGKERIARAIHDLSPRSGRPFVALNAAALSEELFESQLFGHVRGAFTGAVQDSVGHVGEAEGGTLFLDEVAELRPSSQARLLRFLQEREYRRLGEPRVRKANVRVLTAANACLDELVAAGRFRNDLKFRIDAVTLVAPPLRARGGDIALLARHFLEELAARDKVKVPRLSPDALAALVCYSWPGNVRELQNEMGRVVVLVRDRLVYREDLRPQVAAACAAPSSLALSEARRALELEHVTAALERNHGSRTRAAADLGITRQGLYEKIRRLGLKGGTAAS
jgi:DNA-binding NtrC family response regulator/tetratricopeptide (TPR) repeat protein